MPCSFDKVVADANQKLNGAQRAVDSLWNEYNWANGRCNSWWDWWWACPYAGGVWLSYQAATGVLSAARYFVNEVMRGAWWFALEAAKGVLSTAQQVANAVLTGAQWATRNAAEAALSVAQNVVNGIMNSAAWVTENGAKIALTAAEKAAVAILKGTEWAAMNTANAILDAAKGTLTGAQVAVNQTLGAIASGLEAISKVLSYIKLSNFLELYSLGVSCKFDKYTALVRASYDFKIAGIRFTGSFEFDFKDPFGSVVKLAAQLGLGELKKIFPPLAAIL